MNKAIRHLSGADELLGKHIEIVGACKLKQTRSATPFLSLAESIAYQQLNGRAAATIWGRVLALHGGERKFTPKAILDTSDEDLRGAGLSRSKVAALKSLAEHAERRVVPGWAALENLSDEEIIERLTQVRGIGPWTVQMMLIFALGRPDVLPSADFGVQKGFTIVFGRTEMPKPKELLEYGERWRPFRSIASWYLWRATDLKTPLKTGDHSE